jgi:hypothetical protein
MTMLTEHDLLQSPTWFPFEGNVDTVRWVRLDESAYRTASFLDQRLLAGGYEQATCKTTLLRAAAAKLTPRSHYLFHTGHVGSTLLSRLLGTHENLFSVREPSLLRTLADESNQQQATADLRTLLALFGRTWRPNQSAVIKATSFVSELAHSVLASDSAAVAILMYTHPLSYLRGILGGPNSRVEARVLAPARQRRLARRLPNEDWLPSSQAEGELIAMSWLCEMTALHQAAVRFPSRVHWVDFDDFLRDPPRKLGRIFQVLGADTTLSQVEALASGPLMRQYSKAPEYAYDAALRREVHLSADFEHGPEIRRGMQWLERAASHPLARAVIEFAVRPPPHL